MSEKASPTCPPTSLLQRMVLTVVAAFFIIFGVLFAVIGWDNLRRESGQLDRSLLSSAKSIAAAMGKASTHESAAAVAVLLEALATSDSPNRDEEFVPLLVAARLDGSQHISSPSLPTLDVLKLPLGVSQLTVADQSMRLYTAKSDLWQVALVDNERIRRGHMLMQMGAELATYLGMALPIVLLPVWLAVRRVVAPLQQLSDAVAARSPTDTLPLRLPRTFRELVPLQDALNRMFERSAQGIAREKAFVNDAAHELRTPLAVISAQAHVLAHSDDADRLQAQHKLQSAVTRASHLTHQLLRLAKADAAAQATLAAADVMNLARDTLAQFAQRAQAQGTELSLQGPDSLTQHTDMHALRSVFENLIDNALRYGGAGGAVQVGVQAQAVGIELRVSDCGPGIAAADAGQIFERFWRGKSTPAHAAQHGAGLGLAIVFEAVRALGGRVRVQASEPGSGCTMVVNLPSHRVASH
jgi:two-component system, OmpR family, sensor histidine kinase QseC